jgi:ferredoxin
LSTTVTVDPERCIGSADCVRLLPAVFRIRDDLGVAVPLEGAAGANVNDLVRAARNCPTGAIAVVAADGDVLVASAT